MKMMWKTVAVLWAATILFGIITVLGYNDGSTIATLSFSVMSAVTAVVFWLWVAMSLVARIRHKEAKDAR